MVNSESSQSAEESWAEDVDPIIITILVRSWKLVGCGLSDPFAAAAMPIDVMRGSLLQFYKDWPQRGAYGLADWTPFSIGDQATVYAAFLVAASCQRMQEEHQGCDWRVRQASYNAEACRLINKKISDATEAMTDITFLAVALLALAAVSFWAAIVNPSDNSLVLSVV